MDPPLVVTVLDAAPDLPRFTLGSVWSHGELDPLLLLGTTVVAGLYVVGVVVLLRRGDRWPVGRSVSFVVLGLGCFLLATASGLGVYDTTLLSVHMVQHMILSMVAPVFLALGAPVTLALRTLPRRPRGRLLALLHSRLARVLSFPPLTFGLYVLTPWALYFSGWYTATLHSEGLHELAHVHLVVVGCLFFWPLLGVDPVPGRVGYPFRVLLVAMTLPFHAFLGVTIMGQSTLLGGDWYPDLHHGPMGAWLPGPYADQHLAGGILWGSGDLIGLLFFGILFVQWVRSSVAEARREDRRLDLLEARRPGAVGPRPGPCPPRPGARQVRRRPPRPARAGARLPLRCASDRPAPEGARLQRRRRRTPRDPARSRPPGAPRPARADLRRGGHRAGRAPADGRRRHRPGHPRRRGGPGRWHGHRQAAQGRDLPLPPIVVLTGRPQDAWLATWSRAEAAVPHPIDPLRLAEVVTALLRGHVAA